MSQPKPQTVQVTHAPDYRDSYANSVQVRVSVWDFHLVFGTMTPDSPEQMTFRASTGVYLSPQQAKALLHLLTQNVAQYEQEFGAIGLEPLGHSHGPVQ
jgi:flagellar protein FlaG